MLERGPDSFLTEKPAGAELCRELGLGEQLTPSNDANRKTYIVVQAIGLVALPDGLMFLIPTKLVPTALSRTVQSRRRRSAWGWSCCIHRGRAGRMSRWRRWWKGILAQEAVDRLADPLLSGIYGGDATQLSARTVLPKLVEMEAKYGSLTRGMLAAHKKMRAKMAEARSARRERRCGRTREREAPAPRAIFTSLKGGMQQLVDALEARLDPNWVRKSTAVGGSGSRGMTDGALRQRR